MIFSRIVMKNKRKAKGLQHNVTSKANQTGIRNSKRRIVNNAVKPSCSINGHMILDDMKTPNLTMSTSRARPRCTRMKPHISKINWISVRD